MKAITLTIGFLLLADMALASNPVHVKITGCVQQGVLISERTDFGDHVSVGGYRIRVTDRRGYTVDLRDYEAKRIVMRGRLLPGDRFIPDPGVIQILGDCGLTPEGRQRNLKNKW